jgi:large subunit ribosomal protein L5
MLKEDYQKKVIPEMKKEFGYKNDLAVPRIEKVVINTGIGRILLNTDPSQREKTIEEISSDLALITGQKPLVTKSKKSISAFKLRKGMPVGLKVTLRRSRMFDFLDRLINIVIPRMRDFQGISRKSIDKNGNLTLGIKEHIIFPEIQPEKSKRIFGLEITIVTSAKTKEEAIRLFELIGFPLAKE